MTAPFGRGSVIGGATNIFHIASELPQSLDRHSRDVFINQDFHPLEVCDLNRRDLFFCQSGGVIERSHDILTTQEGKLDQQILDRVAVRQHAHDLMDGHTSPLYACLPMTDVRVYRDPVELHVRVLHPKFTPGSAIGSEPSGHFGPNSCAAATKALELFQVCKNSAVKEKPGDRHRCPRAVEIMWMIRDYDGLGQRCLSPGFWLAGGLQTFVRGGEYRFKSNENLIGSNCSHTAVGIGRPAIRRHRRRAAQYGEGAAVGTVARGIRGSIDCHTGFSERCRQVHRATVYANYRYRSSSGVDQTGEAGHI